MLRYSVITEKNKREIILLRGNGCKWKRCRFCNYHLDKCESQEENFEVNREVINNVTGIYGKLEMINSGSFVDLDMKTIECVRSKCVEKNIHEIHVECHYMHKDKIKELRKYFGEKNIDVKVKIGVETFDYLFRECYLVKGIQEENPEVIAQEFNEVCLLQGIPGQTKESMINDIETGLKFFERVCINIMIENGMPIKPDMKVQKIFMSEVYPIYKNNERVDILLNNTDFGVGNTEGGKIDD